MRRKYKYLVSNCYNDAEAICDTRADAEEWCLILAENDAYFDYYYSPERIDDLISLSKIFGYKTIYGCLLCERSLELCVIEVPYVQ